MDRVKGKVAIITGGAGGLGKAQTLLLAKEGAKVVITDIDEVRGKSVVEEVKGQGGKAIFIKHDVTSEIQWSRVISETLEQFGKLDILVNNAGVMFLKNIEDTSLDEWRWLMSINLDGVFLGTKYAIGAMKKSGGGSIINMSSTSGIVSVPNGPAYCASKGGVRIFTKAVALECSKAGLNYNIRVNSVHPGLTKTPMTEGIRNDEDLTREAMSLHPIGRFGEPEDIAYGVLYLASDESAFMTGAELVIDGGWTAQ